MIDFPCKCGHARQWHIVGMENTFQVGSNNNHCIDLTSEGNGFRCWHRYIPDKLKYLEMKYEENH